MYPLLLFIVLALAPVPMASGEDVQAILDGLDKTCPETEKQRKFNMDQCKDCKKPEGCYCGGGLFRQPLTKEQEEEENAKDITPGEHRETSFDNADTSQLTSDNEYPENKQVLIKGGTFQMGTNKQVLLHANDGEGPAREVTVDSFHMDRYAVSNGEFGQFVKQNEYITEAEKFGDSFVMDYFLSKEVNAEIKQAVQAAPWWLPVKGANWRRPEGAGSHVRDRMDHPVVHVSWNDAAAFCVEHGKRLPTEAEWEMACRGGKHDRMYPWGNKLSPRGETKLNIWTGEFPKSNNKSDGYDGTAPVNSHSPQNDFGLHHMVGNVWEWTQDWYTTKHSTKHQTNPQGAPMSESKVKKGGSFMCTQNYCFRYRCAARSHISADSSAHNVGFRCVRTAAESVRTAAKSGSSEDKTDEESATGEGSKDEL